MLKKRGTQMHEVLTIAAVIAIIGYVIVRQLRGEPLRGRRVVLLPVVLIAVGVANLNGANHLKSVDVICIVASAVVAIAIGLSQGAMMHLESRNGNLWGRMAPRGLWLWAALIVSRLVVSAIALALGAKAATSVDSILLVLGLNRLAQAAIIAFRAVGAGVSFAPERDGKVFLAGVLGTKPTTSDPAGPLSSTAGVSVLPTTRKGATVSDVVRRVTNQLNSGS